MAKELSSKDALRLLGSSNPTLAESLRQGRIELDKLIGDLRDLYSLGFLNMIDDQTQYNITADHSLSLERVSQMLRGVGKPLARDADEKVTVLNKLRELKRVRANC